jgi:WD40 repeat protein
MPNQKDSRFGSPLTDTFDPGDRTSDTLFSRAAFVRARLVLSPWLPLTWHPLRSPCFSQVLSKKLLAGTTTVSSLAIHPGGDNLIVGAADRKLAWFDMDLSTKPYKTVTSHQKALQSVCFHRSHPLFASASDDGTVRPWLSPRPPLLLQRQRNINRYCAVLPHCVRTYAPLDSTHPLRRC